MCCCRIFLAIFVILQFIAVAASVIGTPFDMFRPKDSEYNENTRCLTIWGAKEECYSTKYDQVTKVYWELCAERSKRFTAAEVCSIVTIAAFVISFILALVQCCCCLCCKYVCMIFNIVGVATGIVVFAMMLDSWNNRRGPELLTRCAPIKEFGLLEGGPLKIGAGLALFIVAVGVGFINIFIALLPC